MTRTTIKIDGMMCTMCESHVNQAIRRAAPAEKVTSSHKKGESVVISRAPLDEAALRAAIDSTGYRVLSVQSEEFHPRRLFGRA